MKQTKITFLFSIIFILVFFFTTHISSADSYPNNFLPINMEVPCIEAQYDLHIGSRDYSLFGNVMKLQLFFYQNEMMDYPPTGYFGPITENSLLRYQSLRGLTTTGIFDYPTRMTLGQETCHKAPSIQPLKYPVQYPAIRFNS